MSRPRAIAIPILLGVAAACAPAANRYSGSLAPQLGPKAAIYATYTGGLFDRNVHAWFKVERPAYVLVAHLSGEGIIRVLYPESPKRDVLVPANTSIRTPGFLAPYDGVPGVYSLASTPVRTPSARLNSYDGLGHAFIFIIASDQPLLFGQVSDSILWDEIEVPSYFRTHDPRLAIREYADLVTGGAPYTLRFADSYTTTTFTSYADNQWTCARLSMMPYAALGSLGFYYGYRPYCAGERRSLLDSWAYWAWNPYDVATSNREVFRPARPSRPPADTLTVTPPRIDSTRLRPIGPRRRELPEDVRGDSRGKTRARLAGHAQPSRANADRDEPRGRDRSRFERQDAPSHERNVERSEPQRPERIERPQPERTERHQPERTERPQPDRTERAQPARAEPRAAPRPQPQAEPQRTKPPGN